MISFISKFVSENNFSAKITSRQNFGFRFADKRFPFGSSPTKMFLSFHLFPYFLSQLTPIFFLSLSITASVFLSFCLLEYLSFSCSLSESLSHPNIFSLFFSFSTPVSLSLLSLSLKSLSPHVSFLCHLTSKSISQCVFLSVRPSISLSPFFSQYLFLTVSSYLHSLSFSVSLSNLYHSQKGTSP